MADPYSSLLASGTPAPVTPAPASTPQAAPASPPPAAPMAGPPAPDAAPGFASWPNGGLYKNVLPAVNNFSNSVLFGLPKAIMHRLGNDENFSVTPQNKTLGTVSGLAGSAASIPLTGALGVGGGFMANAALGAGLSGAAPAIAGDKDWAAKAGEGAALGAAGAGIGKVVGKLLPGVFQNIPGKTDELANELDKTGLGSLFGLNRGDLKKVLNSDKQFSGSAPGLNATENIVKSSADLARAQGIYGRPALKSFLNGMGPEYEKAATAFDNAGYKVSQPEFIQGANAGMNPEAGLQAADNPIYQKIMQQPEVQSYLKNYGDQGGAEKINQLLANFDKRGSWTEGRAYLTKEQSNFYRTPSGAENAVENSELGEAVGGIKGAITDTGFELGGVDPALTGLYRDSRLLSNLALRKASSPSEFAKAGSKTISGMLLAGAGQAAGGPAGAMGLPVMADLLNRGATAVANKGVGMAALQAAPFVRNTLGPLAEKAAPITNAIASAIGKGAAAIPAAGQVASSAALRNGGASEIPKGIADQPWNAGQAQPVQGQAAKAPETPGFPVDPTSPQFQAQLDQGIRQGWIQRGGNVNDPNFTSPQFQRFSNEIKRQISAAGPNAARVAAPVLFPTNPQNREAYLNFLGQNEDIAAKYPGAQFGNPVSTAIKGLPLVGNPAAITARAQFQDAITKATGGAGAGKALMTQLDRANPKDRPAIIANALARNNPIAARLIQQLGGQQ